MPPIPYTIRRSWKARRIRIIITSTGAVKVTVPFFIGTANAEYFVKQQAAWIHKKLAQIGEKKSEEKQYPPYTKAKQSAKAYLTDLVKKYTAEYGFTHNRITVKNHTTRWGSCSKKKNLNFNYRLLFLPQELAEYVVVHELCHLENMNHSQKFWQRVEEIMPDYKDRRRILKKNF